MTLYEFYQNACAQDAVDETYAAAFECAARAIYPEKETK